MIEALAVVQRFAERPESSAGDLELAIRARLAVAPTSARNAEAAVVLAERAAGLTQHRVPDFLLLLAQSYRAADQAAKAREIAQEGLALLPMTDSGSPQSRLWRLLKLETNP